MKSLVVHSPKRTRQSQFVDLHVPTILFANINLRVKNCLIVNRKYDLRVGDYVAIHEYYPDDGSETGARAFRRISFKCHEQGIDPDFVCVSLE